MEQHGVPYDLGLQPTDVANVCFFRPLASLKAKLHKYGSLLGNRLPVHLPHTASRPRAFVPPRMVTSGAVSRCLPCGQATSLDHGERQVRNERSERLDFIGLIAHNERGHQNPNTRLGIRSRHKSLDSIPRLILFRTRSRARNYLCIHGRVHSYRVYHNHTSDVGFRSRYGGSRSEPSLYLAGFYASQTTSKERIQNTHQTDQGHPSIPPIQPTPSPPLPPPLPLLPLLQKRPPQHNPHPRVLTHLTLHPQRGAPPVLHHPRPPQQLHPPHAVLRSSPGAEIKSHGALAVVVLDFESQPLRLEEGDYVAREGGDEEGLAVFGGGVSGTGGGRGDVTLDDVG